MTALRRGALVLGALVVLLGVFSAGVYVDQTFPEDVPLLRTGAPRSQLDRGSVDQALRVIEANYYDGRASGTGEYTGYQAFVDHPKVAVGPRTVLADPTGKLYPNVVYLCANSLTHTPCTVSVDGGATFGPALPAGFAEPDKGRVTPTCAFQGVPIAAADGTVYQPRGQCGAFVDRSTDNGLTWERHVVAQGEGVTSGDTPDLAVAPDGTVSFFWTGADWQPRLAHSTDGGRTWSAPISVVAATGLRSTLFPVIAAGPGGRIGIAFYGTPDAAPNWSGNPGDAPDAVRWYLYAAVVDGHATGPVTAARITPDPVQIGCLSKLGSCPNPNIADYIDAEMSPDGRLHVAYVDGCPPGCTTAAQSTADEGWVAIEE